MSLIIMCVYDTQDNGRMEYTEKTLNSLSASVDLSKHRIVVIDNNSYRGTKYWLNVFKDRGVISELITLEENIGTARGINIGLKMRNPGEYCIKIDNDVVIHQSGWVDEMEEAIERDPNIGIIGLKRKDIDFDANHENESYRSRLIQLPHTPGQTWITVEGGGQIMGTCTMFNWRLIDKIGGMKQVGVYGMDDSLYDLRSQMAGFWNCYLPHIDISHIDTGQNPYTQLKHKQAGEAWHEYTQLHNAYTTGTRPILEAFE